MERHHRLGETVTLAGWLHRKRRNWLLVSGSKWTKGFWVLNAEAQTFAEYRNEDRKSKTFVVDPKAVLKVQKVGSAEMCILLQDGKEVVLKAQDLAERDRWIDALAELLFSMAEEGGDRVIDRRAMSEGPDRQVSRGKSLKQLVSKSFRTTPRKFTNAEESSGRPMSQSTAVYDRSVVLSESSRISGANEDDSVTVKADPLVQDSSSYEDVPRKRQVVLPVKEPREVEELIDPSRYVKTPEQRQKLVQLVETEFKSFASGTLLNDVDSRAVVELMYRVSVAEGATIAVQGEPADRMFIIESGRVGVYNQPPPGGAGEMELEVEKKENELVGVLSLLYNQPAPFTIKTHTACELWALSSKKFHELSTSEVKRKLWKKVQLVDRIPLIAENIDESFVTQLADSMEYEEFQQGEFLLKSGEEFTRMYVIAEGEASLRKGDEVVGTLRKGDVFGEWALLDVVVKSEFDLIAASKSPPVQVLVVTKSQVEEVVGPLRRVLLERWLEVSEGKPLSMDTAAAVVNGVSLGMEVLEEGEDEDFPQPNQQHQHMSVRGHPGGVLMEVLLPLREAAAKVLGRSAMPDEGAAVVGDKSVEARRRLEMQQQQGSSSERLLTMQRNDRPQSRGLLPSDLKKLNAAMAKGGGERDSLRLHPPSLRMQQRHDGNNDPHGSNRSLGSIGKSQRMGKLGGGEETKSGSTRSLRGDSVQPRERTASDLNPLQVIPNLISRIHIPSVVTSQQPSNGGLLHSHGLSSPKTVGGGGFVASEHSMRSVAGRSSRTAGRSSRTAGRSSRTIKSSDRSMKSMMSVEERRRRASMMAAAMTVITKEQEDQAIAQMMEALKQRENHMRAANHLHQDAVQGLSSQSSQQPPPMMTTTMNESTNRPSVLSDPGTLVIKPDTPSIVVRQKLDFLPNESFYDEDAERRRVEATGYENLDKPFERCVPLRPDLVMSTIELCGQLGKGSFGRVHLARNKRRIDEVFALKVLARSTIVSNGWERMVENEHDAMNELSTIAQSPFIVKLWNSFTDVKNVYLLIEVCEGGDLFRIMKKNTKQGRFTETQAMFYMGCVVLGLEAMHALDIVYRDLKPENLMVARNGYVKLADFGLAKKTLRTFTVCGTPEYMAPETLLSQGQNIAVDWWAAGVTLYELMHGETPFGVGETVDVYEAILDHERVDDLKFPDPSRTAFSAHAKDLIKNLIHPRKNKRLGVKYPGIDGIKQHPFFQDMNWILLEKLGLAAPIHPDVSEVLKYAKKKTVKYDAKLSDVPDDKSGWNPPF